MSSKHQDTTSGLDRWDALFAWWGVPAATGNSQVDDQAKRFQAFASDLQMVYGEACTRQISSLLSANDRIARSLREFWRCQRPQDVLATESNVLATMFEEASLQARNWAELAQKVQGCCAAIAREAADENRQQASNASSKTPAKAAQSAGRDAGRQPVRA